MKIGTDTAIPPAFSQLSLRQTEQVESIRLSSGNTLYSFTFASLFAWREYEQYEICLCDDAFVIRNGAVSKNSYFFPCGTCEGQKRLIDALIPEDPSFYYITDKDKTFLEKEYPNRFSFDVCREDFPYLYDREEQIALNGKAYKNLRHRVNQGRAVAKTWSAESLTAVNIDRALALNARWAEERDAGDIADTSAAETALRNFEELAMWGLVFRADGEDVAYVAGSFITPEIFDINFCKVLDNRCDCYVKWALYCCLPSEVKTVDSEDDMGLEGLRTHKLLRNPKELTRVWKGSLKNE